MAEPEARYFDRELSWLAFNERVLQEAADSTVPLGERLNFLAIFSSNLDEFFRVRVASLRSLLRLKKKKVQRLDIDPRTLLADIHRIVSAQQERFGRILREDLLPELAAAGVQLWTETDLPADQRETVSRWFDQNVRPLIDPVLLAEDGPQPFLQNRAIYLVIELWPRQGRGVGAVAPDYALVRVPSPPLPRFLTLDPTDGATGVMFLDDVIRANLPRLFEAHEVGAAYAIKLSRDAELYLDDEFEGDIATSIRKSLRKRETGLPCRFLYDLQTPAQLAGFLARQFELEPEDLIEGGRYHNLHDLRDLPRAGAGHAYPPLEPLPHPDLEGVSSLIATIAERDRLLHFPYHRFDYVIRLLDEAAADPDVEEIWITLYRVARDSAVADALIRAAAAGKRVTAVVELKARFDEESNLDWSDRMNRSGVRAIHVGADLKVHAKLALIVRRGGLSSVAYLGTGNFNERTARVYTDLALLTADPRLTTDVRRVFAFLVGEQEEPEFEQLLVAPFTLREQLNERIAAEAEAAKAGRAAGIHAKMNSLEDRRIIERLYRASRAGVPIRMIVRGICCLLPGVAGLSDTIHVRSIVDRFLEHARVFIFENGGDPVYYLASADWMTRNLSRRVEVAFPIHDPAIRADIEAIMRLQFEDNVKARIIDEAQANDRARSGSGRQVRAQSETYAFLAKRAAADRTAGASGSPSERART